ncbi:hypothetical protein VM1G_01716 [Cytospora mali]|uniref:Borealin N-terminal domain-containing protein n=1 Tax=Cytospora mali TaxID=578113 RepID=A0A194VP14_CYTMA|nr:hypothetical protein VM1G_01716 [Valsa mali]
MAPPRGTKRKSDESVSVGDQVENTQSITGHMNATRTEGLSAQESPRKRQRTGISLSQKQALVDNLQLEITERARKLRAQYNLQAQGLRTRIEIRVNRIPMALRKAKMGDLADKYRNGQHPQVSKSTPSAFSTSISLPPPVPEKDTPVARQTSQATSHTTTSSKAGPGRPPKRSSEQVLGTDKENLSKAEESEPKKKQRGQPVPEAEPTRQSRVLSPASANVRTLPRTTPGKLLIARSGANTVAGSSSPVKQSSASNLFSNLADKARSTRPGASPRKQTASASTTASSAGGSARGRKNATATGTGTTKGAATGKKTRRFSGISESSEESTSTVVKKVSTKGATGAAEKEGAPPLATKRSVIGTIRKGVTGAGATKKTTAAKTAAPASTATGRVLRKRT